MDAQLLNMIQARKIIAGIPDSPTPLDPKNQPTPAAPTPPAPTPSAPTPAAPLPLSASSSPNSSSSSASLSVPPSASASAPTDASTPVAPIETPVIEPIANSSLPSPTPSIVKTDSSNYTSAAFQTADPSSGSSSAGPSATGAGQASQNTGFLQNKVLSGIVFGVVGLIGLTLIIFVATWMLRRRRNKRLIDEAVSFNPVDFSKTDYPDMIETGRGAAASSDVRSTSSMGSHAQHGAPPVSHSPPFSDYAPPVVYLNSAPSTPRGHQQFAEQQNQAEAYRRSTRLSYAPQYSPNPTGQWNGNVVQPSAPSYYHGPPQPAMAHEAYRSNGRSRSSSTELKFAAPANVTGLAR